MGNKLDALLGRNFNTCKFKTVTKLAISRTAILKNQHQARYSYARSDVIELLNLSDHEQALTRVEYVINEQNMLDALVMIEHYCHLLIERVLLIHHNKNCPDDLKEAILSLIFASSRCGDFPELQKIRKIFSSKFGTEFASRAIKLCNNCRVNPKIVQKLSSRRPSLESRLKALTEIASEMDITLHIEEDICSPVKEKLDIEQKQPKPMEQKDDAHHLPEELAESVKARKRYRDAAAAARDAFESASYAAEAARAAFELARSESQDSDSDNHGGFSNRSGIASNSGMSKTPNIETDKCAVIDEEDGGSNSRTRFDKIYTTDSSESEDVTGKN